MDLHRRAFRRAAEWLGHAALAFVGWLAFTQRLTSTELAAGALAACVAGTASLIVWSHNLATFRGEARALAQVWRLPKYALTGTWEILSVLAAHLAGRRAPSLLGCVRYEDRGDDPRSRARRALAVAYTTITPNFLVLGVDLERGLLWYHQLRRSPVPRMTVNLGARA
jgi:hypothetical protein